MSSKLGIGWDRGLLSETTLLNRLGERRHHLKYLDGRGIYSLVLGPSSSVTAEIVTFIVLPLLFVIGAFWYALRDFK